MSVGSGAVAHVPAADDADAATDALDDEPDEHAAAIRANASRVADQRRGNIGGRISKSVGTRRRG
jgi:hypothetical protein